MGTDKKNIKLFIVTDIKPDVKFDSVMIQVTSSCSRRQHNTLTRYLNQLFKTMSTYGIQTADDIFCLSPIPDHHENTTNSYPPALKKTIHILRPKTALNVFDKLNSVQLLQKFCEENRLACFKGFHKHKCSFDKTLCFTETDEEAVLKTTGCMNSFERVSFDWSGDHHTLSSTTVSTDKHNFGDNKYVLNKLDSHHPIMDSEEYKPVYSSYHQVLPALKLISTKNKQLDLTQYTESISEECLRRDHQLAHPFIVVEGLDGTGKSTLSNNLAKYLNGIQMGTPPPSISPIRRHFDAFPEVYRRSYYALGNYIASEQVIQHCRTQPVVMDRYWHSTTAYAIASEIGCATSKYLPPPTHPIYTWPDDLLYPSAVVFLTTGEEDRSERVNERSEQTEEERMIEMNCSFRSRISEVYRRIGHQRWMEVDTSGTQEETLQKVVNALKLHGVI